MKSLKRLCSLLLALCALLTLSVGALAADAVAAVSKQSLQIDGIYAHPVAYLIDNYNYFKLRDLAYLLSGTTAQFSVDYDESTNTIHVGTGRSYTPKGDELQSLGREDKAAVKSRQPLYIDGQLVSNLTAYNIDGFNFFKLRDLGEALGFLVDWDENARSMLIMTPEREEPSWTPDFTFSTVAMDGTEWTDECFKAATLTVVNLWAYWCGPCVGEMPDFEKLSKNYAGKGVQFIGLYDAREEADDRQTLKDLGITYPNLRYTADFDPYMNTGYIPVTIFVDNAGHVMEDAYVGSRDYAAWSQIIDGYLKELQ